MTDDPGDLDRVRPEDLAHGQEIVRTDNTGRSLALVLGIIVLIAAIGVVVWMLVNDDDDNDAESLPGGDDIVAMAAV